MGDVGLLTAGSAGAVKGAAKAATKADDLVETVTATKNTTVNSNVPVTSNGAANIATGAEKKAEVAPISSEGKADAAGNATKANNTRDKSDTGSLNVGKPITLNNGYYSADGMKISQQYYEKLWSNGRPAPFIQAREVLDSNPKILPDRMNGFNRYEGAGLEMIYNPTTGEIWHIQPIK